jgi:hypothetical protein
MNHFKLLDLRFIETFMIVLDEYFDFIFLDVKAIN